MMSAPCLLLCILTSDGWPQVKVYFESGHGVTRPNYMQGPNKIKDPAAEKARRTTFEDFCEAHSGDITAYRDGVHVLHKFCSLARSMPCNATVEATS